MAKIEGYEMPEELYYHKEHAWARVEDDGRVKVGMNDFFQSAAGDINYVDLPFEGDEIEQDQTCGKLQSAKWIAKLDAPVAGVIAEVNSDLEDDATLINQDPYGRGWIAIIEPSNLEADLAKLYHGEKVAEWLKGEIKKAEETKQK